VEPSFGVALKPRTGKRGEQNREKKKKPVFVSRKGRKAGEQVKTSKQWGEKKEKAEKNTRGPRIRINTLELEKGGALNHHGSWMNLTLVRTGGQKDSEEVGTKGEKTDGFGGILVRGEKTKGRWG